MHHHYMSAALDLARRGRFTVSPNPLVGCVIVKNDNIVGEGFHEKEGQDHAEIIALKKAGEQAQGATAYVTLEPCCHYGKTPPCTQALIKSGLSKVYVACLDPNPLVFGKGVQELREAGITVEIGLCEAEAKQLNQIFFHYMAHKRPFVISKWAMSLDGKASTHPEDSRQISGPESAHYTHELRQQVDAILVGSATACKDNPLLTSRLFSIQNEHKRQPIRIIVSTTGQLPSDLRIFDASLPSKTIIATGEPVAFPNAEVLVLPKNQHGKVCLSSLLDSLGSRGITSLLVEGGMTIHESFFAEDLVNRIDVYLAPVIVGAQKQKRTVENLTFSSLGRDVHFTTGGRHV